MNLFDATLTAGICCFFQQFFISPKHSIYWPHSSIDLCTNYLVLFLCLLARCISLRRSPIPDRITRSDSLLVYALYHNHYSMVSTLQQQSFVRQPSLRVAVSRSSSAAHASTVQALLTLTLLCCVQMVQFWPVKAALKEFLKMVAS